MNRIYLLVDCDGSWGDLAFPFAKIPTPILDEFGLCSVGLPKPEQIDDLPDLLSTINLELTVIKLQLAELQHIKRSINKPSQGILGRLQNQINYQLNSHRQRLTISERETERLKFPKHSIEAKRLTEADRKFVEVYNRLNNMLFANHETAALIERIDDECDEANIRQTHLLTMRNVLIEYFDENVQRKASRMRQALEQFLTIDSNQSNDRYVVSNSARWSSGSELSNSIRGKTRYFENLHLMAKATGANLLPGLLIDAIQLQAPGFTIQKIQQNGLRIAHDHEIDYFEENKSVSPKLLSELIGPGALVTKIIDEHLDDTFSIQEHIANQLERGNKSSVFEYCLHQVNANENTKYATYTSGRRRIVIIDDREDILISLQRLLQERYTKNPNQFFNTDIIVLKFGPTYEDFKRLPFTFQNRVDTFGARTTFNSSANQRSLADTSTSDNSDLDFVVEQPQHNSSCLSTRLRILVEVTRSGNGHDNNEFKAAQPHEEPTTVTDKIPHFQFFSRLPVTPKKSVVDGIQVAQLDF